MLNNEFPPLGGGTGAVNLCLFEQFSKYPDLYIDLVTSSRSRRSYEIEQFSPRITIYKVPVNNQNIHHSSNLELIRYFVRGLALSLKLSKTNRYEMSFSFAGVPAGAISYVLSLVRKLPYWISLQGPDVPGFEGRYCYLYPFLKPLIRSIWRNAAIVTAISEQQQRLAAKTMPELIVPIFHNGVDTDLFRPVTNNAERTLPNIVCVGRLIERKGQHYLIRAFSQLLTKKPMAATLTFVGTGDSEESLRLLAKNLGIDSSVTFRGFVPRHEMPSIYRDADVFVLPSQSEGMSMALLESMACGLPVVVTDVGGTQELVKDGVNGLVIQWADVSALVAAVERVIDDHELRQTMGRQNRLIAQNFNWQSIARSYIRTMQECFSANVLEQPHVRTLE